MDYASALMKTRFLSLFLAFALLINFSGVHALAAELGIALNNTASMRSHGESGDGAAHSGCAMHAHSDVAKSHHACDKAAKKAHVCGSLKCDCGCHLSPLTFAAIGITGVSHGAKLALFQPQHAPLPPVKLNLRPPISA